MDNPNTKYSICLSICYFGNNFPNYFDYFLKTASWNPTIDFFIFSNIKFEKNIPKNVKLIDFNITEFNELASRKLAIPVQLEKAYKLCDFKPAYGKIFEDFFLSYDFWGHIDIDILLGNIRAFLTDDFLADCDFFSSRKEFPSGFFSLFKNTDQMCCLFKESKDWEKVFTSNKYWGFDECNQKFYLIVNEKKSIFEIDREIESMLEVIEKKREYLKIKMISFAHELQFRQLLECSEKGIMCLNTKENFLVVHFISINRNILYGYKELNKQDNKFYIDIFGIIPCKEDDKLTVELRNIIVLNGEIELNYKLLNIQNPYGIFFTTETGVIIDLSSLNWFESLILFYIHKNYAKKSTGNLIFNFLNESNLFNIDKNPKPPLDDIKNLVLNLLGGLMEESKINIKINLTESK